MPWIVTDGEVDKGVIVDHDRCDWVIVSSGSGSPELSWTKSREP